MRFTAAVITVSDKGFRGERADTSGPMLCKMLIQAGYDVICRTIVPDEMELIRAELIRCADEARVSLILTTGGTGFSPRDITPEATLSVIERETRGIPEAMRAESLRITPRGCLSRSAAGIRGRTLIVNLPGSEKAARENLAAVLPALGHGLEILASEGSADCAAGIVDVNAPADAALSTKPPVSDTALPDPQKWLREAKADAAAANVGMYLLHNGIVRATAKSLVRDGDTDTKPVCAMELSCDRKQLAQAIEACKEMPGISFVRVWVNEGRLKVGDDIMYALVGGDIRPNVTTALHALVDRIKSDCVTETEIYAG